MPDTQTTFQQNLISALGLDSLPQEKKDELLIKISEVVQQRIILRVLSELSEEDRQAFDGVLSANDDEKSLAFLQEKIPNFEAVVKDEIEKFRNEAMTKMQAILNF